MRRAIIGPDGTLALGDQAARLGFVPGAVVEISMTCIGSLFIMLDDQPVAVDASYRRLIGGAAQLARRRALKGEG